MIRKDTKGYQWVIALSVLVMLITMHYFDEKGLLFIPKIILTVMILASFLYSFYQYQISSDKMTEQIRSDKKSMKNVRKNLSNFDTRIVSQIQASPGSFAKILGNDLLYQDFRFDIHHKYTESKQEKERMDKSQSLHESVYIELAKSKGDIESRQEKYV